MAETESAPAGIYYPEDRIAVSRIIPLGMQHVIAMFGATVLAPVLMGFNAQTAVFFSGVGTLIFLVVTRFKVPSYLGSSFSYIGPVLAVTGGNPAFIPHALFGIAASAVCYLGAAVYTIRKGSAWIDRLMPPLVTGSVVAIIGLNLAPGAVNEAMSGSLELASRQDWLNFSVAAITFTSAGITAIYARGMLRLIPILTGVLVGCVAAWAAGLVSQQSLETVRQAAWFGLPRFIAPVPDWGAVLVIAPLFVVLVAENKGHIDAISAYMKRDLTPSLGRAYLGDALATLLSACGGGTPQTTYAENMSVMAITGVFATRMFAVAAGFAALLGLCPKFGAATHAIPMPVIGGVSVLLCGLITLMGVKIWIDNRLDLCSPRNLIVAGATLMIATGLGVKGITVGTVNIAGIAFGTVFAVVMNWALSAGSAGLTAEEAKACLESGSGV
ncbi:MAG: solute carrier family 23 protein [Elusimicrobiaceae bacterium]|nr:solute carrier family 23 protein [Elusimicrobiaceae bacterium]